MMILAAGMPDYLGFCEGIKLGDDDNEYTAKALNPLEREGPLKNPSAIPYLPCFPWTKASDLFCWE